MKRSLAFVFCLAVAANVESASAQPPQGLDILGVQLGMPRETAVHLLQSRNPPYSITNTNAPTIEGLGSSVWHVSLANQTALTVDTIDLDFAPPPTASTVLRVFRNVCYSCNSSGKTNPEAPSVDNFVRGLAEKLKTPTPTVVESHSNLGEHRVYVWTSTGEFLSSVELNRRLPKPYRCINRPPRLDDSGTNVGVNFNLQLDDKSFGDTCGTVVMVDWSQENGIITKFDMDFSDVAGLMSAFSKSAALINAKNANRNRQELKRANQNGPAL